MKRALCIWLPNWPIQRRASAPPVDDGRRGRGDSQEDAGRVLVLYGAGSRGLRVTACSRAARALGAAVGMPLAEAASLAKLTGPRCTDAGKTPRWAKAGLRAGRIEFLPEDAAADREALEELAGWCQRYSPLVSVEEAERPESLLIDATGCGRCFHGEPALVEKISRELAERGWESRTAIADTIGAAWALAHYGLGGKTHGVVAPGRGERLLAGLPIEALRLPAESVETLQELGVLRVGELARLPTDLLAARLGPIVVNRLRQATGQAPEVLASHRPLPFVEARLELEHPVARLDLLEAVLEKMLERLLWDLPPGCGVGRLCGRLASESAEPTAWEVELCRPSASASHWRKLLHLRLERVRLQAPATSLHLWGGSILRLDQRQEELFPEAQSARLDARLDLFDRLSSRLGRRRVLRPRLVADAQPELVCRYEPVVGSVARRKNAPPSTDQAAWRPPAPRPLFLQRTPELLAAASVAPDGPPIRLWLGRPPVEHRVARSWGPERIETGWRRGRPIRRDYYRVETASGRRLWIFRDLNDGRWFLHGWF